MTAPPQTSDDWSWAIGPGAPTQLFLAFSSDASDSHLSRPEILKVTLAGSQREYVLVMKVEREGARLVNRVRDSGAWYYILDDRVTYYADEEKFRKMETTEKVINENTVALVYNLIG